MEALAALALPHVLQSAYLVLTVAWTKYESVQEQKAQCGALLQRCTDLLLAVATSKQQSNIQSNDPMLVHVRSLDSACTAAAKVIGTLVSNGFAWRLLHQSDIRNAISSAETAVQAALDKFNVSAHLGAHKLQVEMAAAGERDLADLGARLDRIARNDQLVLNALQDGDQKVRRLEELVIAFTKYGRKAGKPENRKTDVFIESATSALQRLSKTDSAVEIPPWSLTSLEVTIDRSGEGTQLGMGSFGCVYKGDWNGQVVAVKEMHMQDARLLDDENLMFIRREIRIWSRLAHPSILPFYGACLETAQPFIVSKLCSRGNVIQFLTQFPQTNRIQLLHEAALGMTYLHDMGVIHADLKGVNILVGDDGKALICDFGLAKLEDELSATGRKSSTRPLEGTMQWMAPERLDGEPLDFPSDVYSYGITAWELYSGQAPFRGALDRVIHRLVVDKKERPSRPESLTSDPLWSIITGCWEAEPEMRPTFLIIQAELRQLTSHGASTDEVAETEDGNKLLSMHNLGVDQAKQGQYSDAEVLLKQVIVGREKQFGTGHKDTLSSMHWLAYVYAKQKQYDVAEVLFKQVIAGREKAQGPEHRYTLSSLQELACVYYHQKQYGDAETLFKRVIAGREKARGPEHQSTLSSINWLASVHDHQKRYGDAEALFKRVIADREKAQGPEHEDTLSSMHSLACVYDRQKRYDDAEALLERVIAGREKAKGPEHENTLSSMHWLAYVYYHQKRYGDAEALFKWVIAGQEKALGTLHEYTLTSTYWLGRIFTEQIRYGDAETLFKRVIAGREKTLGPEHEETLAAKASLLEVYKQWGC